MSKESQDSVHTWKEASLNTVGLTSEHAYVDLQWPALEVHGNKLEKLGLIAKQAFWDWGRGFWVCFF